MEPPVQFGISQNSAAISQRRETITVSLFVCSAINFVMLRVVGKKKFKKKERKKKKPHSQIKTRAEFIIRYLVFFLHLTISDV